MAEPLLVRHAGLRPTTEAEVARECDELALKLGWRVGRLEQRRPSNILLGLPDRRYVGAHGFRVWAELKKPGGKLTRAQHQFLEDELAAGALALPVDDAAVLAQLFSTWRPANGTPDALRYCRDVLAVTLARGYRDGNAPVPKVGRGRRRRETGR